MLRAGLPRLGGRAVGQFWDPLQPSVITRAELGIREAVRPMTPARETCAPGSAPSGAGSLAARAAPASANRPAGPST